jgi:UTP--glucose-1-phosphate uridylyltransferase
MIPAAGFGTRLRPLTIAIPKEMLPLGRKPVLEYVVEELRDSGLTDLLFIVSPGKEMIRAYFGDGSRWGVRCDYVIQPEMRGLGEAILRGEEWAGSDPVLVAFGDCIIDRSGPPACARLVETFAAQQADAAVITEAVPRERTRRYGVLKPADDGSANGNAPFLVTGIVEKPDPERAPSTWVVAARYILGPRLFDHLHRTTPGPDGEVSLSDAVATALEDGCIMWAIPLIPPERRRDIGGWDSYLVAAARAAVYDAEFGSAVRADLRDSETTL